MRDILKNHNIDFNKLKGYNAESFTQVIEKEQVMIDVLTATVVLANRTRHELGSPVLETLSSKGLAAAYLATAQELHKVTNGNLDGNLDTFPEYWGLLWIKDRLSQMRADLSVEVNELDDEHRANVDTQFLKQLRIVLKKSA